MEAFFYTGLPGPDIPGLRVLPNWSSSLAYIGFSEWIVTLLGSSCHPDRVDVDECTLLVAEEDGSRADESSTRYTRLGLMRLSIDPKKLKEFREKSGLPDDYFPETTGTFDNAPVKGFIFI